MDNVNSVSYVSRDEDVKTTLASLKSTILVINKNVYFVLNRGTIPKMWVYNVKEF